MNRSVWRRSGIKRMILTPTQIEHPDLTGNHQWSHWLIWKPSLHACVSLTLRWWWSSLSSMSDVCLALIIIVISTSILGKTNGTRYISHAWKIKLLFLAQPLTEPPHPVSPLWQWSSAGTRTSYLHLGIILFKMINFCICGIQWWQWWGCGVRPLTDHASVEKLAAWVHSWWWQCALYH